MKGTISRINKNVHPVTAIIPYPLSPTKICTGAEVVSHVIITEVTLIADSYKRIGKRDKSYIARKLQHVPNWLNGINGKFAT